MKSRIENNTVVEILDANPFPDFHPSLVWVDCDASVRCGDLYNDGVFATPAPVVVTTVDPVVKLKSFLAANPDVAELLK